MLRNAIAADLRVFCRRIGNRLAGSPAEKKAADFTARRFRELGLDQVRLLPFPCRQWVPGGGSLRVLAPIVRNIPIQVITHTPPTPAGGLEGDLAVLEPMHWENGLRVKGLRGKIGLFYGGFGESPERFRELQESELAALLFCDTRLPMPWPIAEGMGEKYMAMVRKPMANLSMLDAYALIRAGARRVRLVTAGVIRDSVSHNVVAEWPGADPAGRVLVACAHLDSVAVGVGADDDASGMAALFAIARLLRGRRRQHTLRFIGFGAEEQLSVGSTHYVRNQIADLARVGFVCNLDSMGAVAGRSEAMCCGTSAFERYVRGVVDRRLGLAQAVSDASPYQDQFPFAAAGIPGLWLRRMTHHEHYWYHHSIHNNLANVSPARIADMAAAAAALLDDLAGRKVWPFPRALAPDLRRKVRAYRRLFA
jgi:hypothetical protein